MARLPHWIDFFLAEVRGNFPDIRLVYTLEGEAATQRHRWGNGIRQYNAKAAGYMELNKLVTHPPAPAQPGSAAPGWGSPGVEGY